MCVNEQTGLVETFDYLEEVLKDLEPIKTATTRNPTFPDLRYRSSIMLYTIAVVLLILWLLGLVTSYTIGGFIHILLVIAIVMILVRVIGGRGVL